MPRSTICKTVHQYNKEPIPPEDMERLLCIAEDYKTVKNYVYARYGGVGGLPKLYPGYTVQNEMTASGLRDRLQMPSVYFYLAVFDALGDIKSQWTRTKTKILGRVNKNSGLTEQDKHYLRFVLKVPNAWEKVLNKKPMELKKELQTQYDKLAADVDTGRLNRYLCRQARRIHVKLHTDSAEGFSISERAYRYGDHGIYISVKEKRKRIFVPLTDHNQYKRQLYIKLYPQQGSIEIKVPVDVSVRVHLDYEKQVGLAFGMYTMLTTDEGHSYGEEFGRYQSEYAGWLQAQAASYYRSCSSNSGRKKYHAKKRRMEEHLHTYINQELNRFLRIEKPQTVYVQKMPKPQAGGVNKKINRSVTLWQRGYIRRRLNQKCREQSVEIIEVLGRGISRECSVCGHIGKKEGGRFTCPSCGYSGCEKANTARNIKNRGQCGAVLH